MSFLESFKDGLDRILPKRNKAGVFSKSMSGGIASTVGAVTYHDEVRFSPVPSFRSSLVVAAFYLSLVGAVAMHRNLDVPVQLGLRNSFFSPALCRCLYGPVWHAGLAPLRPPAMGHLACGHSILCESYMSVDHPFR